MQPGDLVLVIQTINRENVWTTGIIIRRDRKHESHSCYEVLLDGRTLTVHESNIKKVEAK